MGTYEITGANAATYTPGSDDAGRLAPEVARGMREAASRGFWMCSRAPYGYRKVMAQDGAKKRPMLEINPATASVVRRMFEMTQSGKAILDITRTLND